MNILKSVSVQICLSKCLNIFEKRKQIDAFFALSRSVTVYDIW